MQTAMNTPTSSPTVSPLYKNIPLPPSDTCTEASTRFASPEYMPHTPSPVNYWMPEHEDVMDEHREATEYATFIAARRFTFSLSWAGAIRTNRRANPRGPPLSVCITKPLQILIFNPLMGQVIIQTQPELLQPTALPALTQQQLQWLEEDLRVETLTSTLPPYRSRATMELADDDNIPALDLILEEEDLREETPAPVGPMPRVHLGPGWLCNANKETGSPIFHEYVIDNGLEIIAPYYQLNLNTDSPKLLLTCGRRCTVHSHTLRACKDPYPCPALTCKQRYSFEANQPFSHLVDWALD